MSRCGLVLFSPQRRTCHTLGSQYGVELLWHAMAAGSRARAWSACATSHARRRRFRSLAHGCVGCVGRWRREQRRQREGGRAHLRRTHESLPMSAPRIRDSRRPNRMLDGRGSRRVSARLVRSVRRVQRGRGGADSQVHHGGAGTTAAALLAGVPTIVTPFSFDQQRPSHANARRRPRSDDLSGGRQRRERRSKWHSLACRADAPVGPAAAPKHRPCPHMSTAPPLVVAPWATSFVRSFGCHFGCCCRARPSPGHPLDAERRPDRTVPRRSLCSSCGGPCVCLRVIDTASPSRLLSSTASNKSKGRAVAAQGRHVAGLPSGEVACEFTHFWVGGRRLLAPNRFATPSEALRPFARAHPW